MNLQTPLSEIKGVGPKTVAALTSSGLKTVHDLLEFFPRRYEDFTHAERIVDLMPGAITIRGHIDSVSTRFVRRNMRITTAVISDDSGSVSAVWFNQSFREKNLKSFAGTNQEFLFSGEFKLSNNRYQLSNPAVEKIDIKQNFFAKNFVDAGTDSQEKITPIYPARGGLKSSSIRKILRELRPMITMLPENLPEELLTPRKLISRSEAVTEIHFPTNQTALEDAKRRLSFEELFQLILAARMNKHSNQKLNGFAMDFNSILPEFREMLTRLPFQLTDAQRKATWEIIEDFSRKTDNKTTPMNRLLQGDVGSGKTIVAGLASFVAIKNNLQVALMAPTEILANQHAKTLSNLLEPLGIRVALLTGSVKGKFREELLQRLKAGEIDLLIGTHALFQPNVEFAKLGFVVIDEQHRFGVKQRQDLLAKTHEGFLPHLLAMTATPIPRSLQLTVFGDLDISILDQLPGGRKPIKTEIVNPLSRKTMNQKIREELAAGRQIYFIAPNIEENKASDNDRENVANLAKKVMREFADLHVNVGILHGKMDGESKEKIMREFANNQLQILVSTTVVEVGVDVPNASIMVIENADNFGLAQLHQLRGRVGRGDIQSYCFLVQSDNQQPTQRLREMEKSSDGFYLAQRDLELRGAGEIYGSMQHGALDLKIANLADTKMISSASRAVDEFFENSLTLEDYPELAREIAKYQRLTTLN